MKVYQFVHTLNYGDAISGEALAIQAFLRHVGIEEEILALHAHEKVAHHCSVLSTKNLIFEEKPCCLIHHYSIASPFNELFKGSPAACRVVIFHNLTPDHWFLGYNPRVVKDLRQGAAELPEILDVADVVLADSEFNARELQQFGCMRAEVLPLLIDTQKWQIPANPGIEGILRSQSGSNVLHVGRLAPNKCLEDIIKTFYFYHHKIDPKSKLWLIGSDIDTEIYSFELKRLVSELRLKEAVEFVGSVADSELRAFYEGCDAYLCMSEHEGFCMPLIEAMHFGLPVIAYASTAVGETLGSGGILLEEKQPALIAELLDLVVKDAALRSRFIAEGKRRAQGFSESAFRERFREAILNRFSSSSTSQHFGSVSRR